MPELVTDLIYRYREATLADLTRSDLVVIKPFDQNSKGKVLTIQKNAVNISSLSDLDSFFNGTASVMYGPINDVLGEIPIMQDPTDVDLTTPA